MKTNYVRCFRLILIMVAASWIPVAVAQTDPPSGQAAKPASLFLGEKKKVEGTIMERNGEKLTLRLAESGASLAVKLSGFTEIQERKSNPFRRARKYSGSQLVPGLAVEVEGRGDDGGALVADKIRFTNHDFEMAQTIDVRVAPVEENARRMSGQISELEAVSNAARGGAKAAQESADKAHERIGSLDAYEAVESRTIRFAVGSAVLSREARSTLDELALNAKSWSAYVIEVAGFASSEGNPDLNRRLSRQRAQVVSEYLAEQHDISLRRIMTPTGYGVSRPVADNSTRTGRQENRRVEVKILVSRGIATSLSADQPPIPE